MPSFRRRVFAKLLHLIAGIRKKNSIQPRANAFTSSVKTVARVRAADEDARKVRGPVAVAVADRDGVHRNSDRNVAGRSAEVRVQDQEEVVVGHNAEGRHSAGRVRHSATVRSITIVHALEETVNSVTVRNLVSASNMVNARVVGAVALVKVVATGRMPIVAVQVVRAHKVAEAAGRKAAVVAVRSVEDRRKVAVSVNGVAEVVGVNVAAGVRVPAAVANVGAEAVVRVRNVADREARQVAVATEVAAAKITIRNNRRQMPVVKAANPFAGK
jgi:hypothetical protein